MQSVLPYYSEDDKECIQISAIYFIDSSVIKLLHLEGVL